MAVIPHLQVEHYHQQRILGAHEVAPRLSWTITQNPYPSDTFQQFGYIVKATIRQGSRQENAVVIEKRIDSSQATLVPWPFEQVLGSRQCAFVQVRLFDQSETFSDWSAPFEFEAGLLERSDWASQRVTAPWSAADSGAVPEHLYRREFEVRLPITRARLYVTAQGVYEAEINSQRIGDYFLAPGWTSYDGRLQYQTYDVTSILEQGPNCIGIRVAEGWFCGRIGFEGGHRNIWGPHVSLLAQLEITYEDGQVAVVGTNGSWTATEGPIRLAEIYDGEKYDATFEIPSWSSPAAGSVSGNWHPVKVMDPLPSSTALVCGYAETVRRIETLRGQSILQTPSSKMIVDFGQNLVGYVRISGIKGLRGHKITISHAEVLENGELGTRPLRICKATDEYILKGSQEKGEDYEPRFTFHGFRYVQVEGWSGDFTLENIEAIVCHTDMKKSGAFACSDKLLNQLYSNICWGMRGNFLSVPTDCPQRDERLGWSGDLSVFAPTATLLYDCFGILKNWLVDMDYDQGVLNGVPPMVSPNATLPDPKWCRRIPCAIWHDVTILAPWELYQESGDVSILAQQYNSMVTWMEVLPRRKNGLTHLWDDAVFQLGDWLDPAAPPDRPWESATDARMVANMFLVRSLELMVLIAGLLRKEKDEARFKEEAQATRRDFQHEYITPSGRLVSDSQAAYALAICFDLLTSMQEQHAAERLVYLVRKNGFRIATGFAGTPFVCEALAKTGHVQVAYAMLLEKSCPSWLYPVTMGATTVWERWDSMLPDGSINPGEMTSFNHYAFGAIAKFMYNHIAGLQRLSPAWTRCRIAPAIGAEFAHASAMHETRRGTLSSSWETTRRHDEMEEIVLKVSAPFDTIVEIVLPASDGEKKWEVQGPGEWSFSSVFERDPRWPMARLPPKS